MAKKTTIRDIALELGVSPATVSLALNKQKGVSPIVAQRIREHAFEKGYNKNVSRQSKGLSGTQVCLLLVIKYGGLLGTHYQSFLDSYLMGMMRYAMWYGGVNLEVRTLSWENFEEDFEAQERHSGYVVLATELGAEEIDLFAQHLNMPVVFIDSIYDHLPYDFVGMNNIDVIYKIVAHLASQGRESISFVGSKHETLNFQQRELAVKQACAQLSLHYQNSYSIEPDCSSGSNSGTWRMQKLLQQVAPAEALICGNDFIAYNCIKALSALNYRIPEDVAVVGFDNLAASSLFSPALSSVEVPKQEIGSLALFRLLSKLPHNVHRLPFDGQSPYKQKLSCEFIPRASSGELQI